MASDIYYLPNGIQVMLKREYTMQESQGVIFLIVASCLSLGAVVLLSGAIMVSVAKTRTALNDHLFLKTHVAGYFFSLMLCHVFQAVGSIMSSKWVSRGGLEAGGFCVSQGVLKHVSDVGTALWTFVIASHAFCLLFWEMEGLSVFTLRATLVGGWSAIGAIVISGPAVLEVGKMGPYYGISGLWCWIAPQYKVQQVLLGWLLLLLAAIFSLILYTLIFLRLRGNITREGWRIRLVKTVAGDSARWRGLPTDHSVRVAKQMLLYPVAYTVVVLPIVIVQWAEQSGREVALSGLIFSGTVYHLSGVVQVVLFVVTQPVLSRKSLCFRGWNISWPFERKKSLESRAPVTTARFHGAPPPRVPQEASQVNGTRSIRPGPSWTQREIKQPPEIVIRDSIGSIYSIYDERPQFQFEPPPSSHWSPDTPPKTGRR